MRCWNCRREVTPVLERGGKLGTAHVCPECDKILYWSHGAVTQNDSGAGKAEGGITQVDAPQTRFAPPTGDWD